MHSPYENKGSAVTPIDDDPVYRDATEVQEGTCCRCRSSGVSKECCLMFSVVVNFLLTCVLVGIALYFLLISLDLFEGIVPFRCRPVT